MRWRRWARASRPPPRSGNRGRPPVLDGSASRGGVPAVLEPLGQDVVDWTSSAYRTRDRASWASASQANASCRGGEVEAAVCFLRAAGQRPCSETRTRGRAGAPIAFCEPADGDVETPLVGLDARARERGDDVRRRGALARLVITFAIASRSEIAPVDVSFAAPRSRPRIHLLELLPDVVRADRPSHSYLRCRSGGRGASPSRPTCRRNAAVPDRRTGRRRRTRRAPPPDTGAEVASVCACPSCGRPSAASPGCGRRGP